MKKINNRGFAISTMLYGLLIIMVLMMALLMSTLAFTRNNSKKFVNEVVDKLQKREMNITVDKIVENDDLYYSGMPEEAKGNFYKNEQYKFDIKVKVNNSITPVKINCSPSEVVAYPKIGTTSLSYGTNICSNVSKVSGEENTFEIKNISISTGNNYGDLTVNLMDGLFINEDGEKTKASSIKIGTVNNSNDECNIKLAYYSLESNNTIAKFAFYISKESGRTFKTYGDNNPIEQIAGKLDIGFFGYGGVMNDCIVEGSLQYGTLTTDYKNWITYQIHTPSTIEYTNNDCRFMVPPYILPPSVMFKLYQGTCGNSNDIVIETPVYFCNNDYTNCTKNKYSK